MKAQLIFNIISIVFLLWMCFRWSTAKFQDSIIKVGLFLTAVVGIVSIMKQIDVI